MNTHKKHSLVKILGKVCWALTFGLVAMVLASYLVGDDWVLPWYIDTTYIKSPLFLEYFTIQGKPMGFELDQIVSWEQYKTGQYFFLVWPEYVLLSITLLCFAAVTLTLTYLERFWYLVCAGIVVFVSINFGFDELGILPEYLTFVFIGIFLVLSYYFQAINQTPSLTTRISIIAGTYLVFTLLVIRFSPILEPQFVWLSFGLFAPLILAGLFLVFIAGDNCFFLFKIATQNAPSGKNGLIHFLIIGAVYIALLCLLFFDLTGQMQIDIILIDPYLIIMISICAGYYTLERKLEIINAQLPVRLIKHVLYPLFSALTLALVIYAEFNANDSLANSLQLFIVVAHLAFACVYYIYCFMNFTPYLMANEPIWHAFFKGERAPLLTARIAAIIFITGALFFLNYKPYYHLKAGQYNTLGALAENVGNDLLASQYYRQAIFYDYASVKANYGLAMIEKRGSNPAQAIRRFDEASLRSDNHKPDLALSQYYSDKNQLFNKLLRLKEVQKASQDQKVINSLAIAHYEFNHLDTAIMLMQKAYEMGASPTIMGNYLAMGLSIKEGLDADSVLSNTSQYTDPRILANRQAFANATSKTPALSLSPSADSLLLNDELYYLYNAALSHKNGNEELLSVLNYYLANPRNTAIADYLKLGKAIQLYNLGRVNDAFFLLDDMIATYGRNAGLYSFIKALWAYHQGAFDLGIVFLADARSYNFDREVIAATYLDLRDRQIDEKANGLSDEWIQYEKQAPSLSDKEKKQVLIDIASKNALDEAISLQAINTLQQIKANTDTIYHLLQKAITLNKISASLYEAYIYQTVESGLGAFGKSALDDLKNLVSEEKYLQVRANFEAKIAQRALDALNPENLNK